MQTNNAMPQAIELEQKLLGAIISNSETIDTVCPILTASMFYVPKHEVLYSELLLMRDKGDAIDISTVAEKLKTNRELAKCFKVKDIVSLTEGVMSIPTEDYALIIKEKYIAREVHRIGLELISKSNDTTEDIEDVIIAANKGIDRINELAAGHNQMSHISRNIEKALTEAENRCKKTAKGQSSGITTGIRELDKMLHGWQPSTLNIIAARPSMGKTALMLHFAKSAAKQGYPGCIYSLEMSGISLANRMILSACNVDIDRFKSGALMPKDWVGLTDAQTELSKLPIYVDDNAVVSMRYIKSHATVMRKKRLCDWIMIDYLQLADMRTDEKGRNREQEVAQASRQAKIIAKELGIPVILLSQLSRGVEQRTSKRPQLSDLRESGAIEQDADTVTFIHRPAYYKEENVHTKEYGTISSKFFGMLYIEKHRDGATGSVKFLHDAGMTKILDYTPDNHRYLIDGDSSMIDTEYDAAMNDDIPF